MCPCARRLPRLRCASPPRGRRDAEMGEGPSSIRGGDAECRTHTQVSFQSEFVGGERIGDPQRLSVIIVGSSYLKSVAEGTDDIAKGRLASQSSTLGDLVAARGNDGDAQPWLYLQSVSCTLVEAEPWWRVELGALHLVAKVEIVSAQSDAAGDAATRPDLQLRDVVVLLLRVAVTAWSQRIATLAPQHAIWLEPAVLGTAVEVRRLERAQLCLAEVLVFPTQ
jgi:hypothetical protein